MIYIYDILLNWTDTDKIYEFFEWYPNDSIEHIKKIPLIKVDSKTLFDFIHNDIEIDTKFLELIKEKSEIFCQKSKEIIDYAALFSDEKQAIAIEFDEKGHSLYRSRLLLDEEIEILEISERLTKRQLAYKIISKCKNSFYLTRNEEMMKRYLLKELKNTYQSKNINKLHYLYTEYFDDDSDSLDDMYKAFMKSLNREFNEKHLQLYKLLKLSHTKKQV